MNDWSNFGTAIANSRQATHIAVEQVMHVAEERHSQAMASMAETTNLGHQQQMASVIREANDALQRQAHEASELLQMRARNHASDTQRVQQEAVTAVRNAEHNGKNCPLHEDPTTRVGSRTQGERTSATPSARHERTAESDAQFARERRLPRPQLGLWW